MSSELKGKPELLKEYDNVIKEQLDLGIIEKVPRVDLAEQCHFLNHHCVVRDNAATTRVRIVFNGSDKLKVVSTVFLSMIVYM